MKKIFSALFIVLFLTVPASAAEAPDLLSEYAESYGSMINENLPDGIIPDFDAEALLQELNSGNISLSPRDVLHYIINLLLGEAARSSKLLAIVLALSVLCSYLSGLKEGFGGDTIANCAFYVCYVIIAGIAAAAFYDTAVCAAEAVRNISFFMRFIVPVIITTLVTSGSVISAATLEPALLIITEAAVWIIEVVFIPAVLITAALNIVGGMSDKFKTDRLVKLLGSAVRWGLTATLTIFVSLAGIKSIASSGVDALTLKLGKFAASNLIPMVGGILSESIETVMSCSAVIKNSVGIVGILCIAAIALTPVLKISAVLIMFRLAAAIAEPVSEPKIVLCLSRLADSVSVLFSMLTAVTVMFIMVLTIMINVGGSPTHL